MFSTAQKVQQITKPLHDTLIENIRSNPSPQDQRRLLNEALANFQAILCEVFKLGQLPLELSALTNKFMDLSLKTGDTV
jgi:hypothetical protein